MSAFDALSAQADVAGSGELLWPPGAALDVVAAAVELGLAVFAGEIYEPRGEAIGCFRDEWMTRRRGGEPWTSYVERAAERTSEEIGPEADVRYFLALCDEAEYPEALR